MYSKRKIISFYIYLLDSARECENPKMSRCSGQVGIRVAGTSLTSGRVGENGGGGGGGNGT